MGKQVLVQNCLAQRRPPHEGDAQKVAGADCEGSLSLFYLVIGFVVVLFEREIKP